MKTTAIALLGLLAIGMLAGVPGPQAQEVLKVEKGLIKTVRVQMQFEGTFEPVTQHVLRCIPDAYPGDLTIAEVKPHGAKVIKQDILIRFDQKPLDDRLSALEAEAQSVRAVREREEEEFRLIDQADRLAIEQDSQVSKHAQARVTLFNQYDKTLDIQDADLEVQRIKDALEDQRRELDELNKMYKSEELSNATAEIVKQRAERAVARLQTQLEVATQRAKRKKENDVQMKLDELQITASQAANGFQRREKITPLAKKEKEARVRSLRVEVDRLASELESLRADFQKLQVRAPMEGVLYYGIMELGRWVRTLDLQKILKVNEKIAPGKLVLTVAGGALNARIEVPEKDMEAFRAGLNATVIPVGFPSKKWDGTTMEPAPVTCREDAGGQYFEARVKVQADFEPLKPGMKCVVTVVDDTTKTVFTVPASAVVDEGGRKVCHVRVDEQFVPRPVKISRADRQKVEVYEGLREGDEILVNPRR